RGSAFDVLATKLVARACLRPYSVGRYRAVRRLFLDAPTRHLLRHHHTDLLTDLLRDRFHVDRSHRWCEWPQLSACAVCDSLLFFRGVYFRNDALVCAGGGDGIVFDSAADHAFPLRHGAAIDP